MTSASRMRHSSGSGVSPMLMVTCRRALAEVPAAPCSCGAGARSGIGVERRGRRGGGEGDEDWGR